MLRITKRNFFLIIGVAILLVLIGFGVLSILKNRAERKYNYILSSINEAEQKRTEYVIEESTDLNQLISNDNALTFDKNYNYNANKEKLNDSSRIVEQFGSRYKTFCTNYTRDYFDSTDIPSKGKVFLLSKEKIEQLAKLKEILAEREHMINGCDNLEGVIAVLKFDNDYSKAFNDIKLETSSNYKDLSTLPSLAKFDDGTYHVDNISEIKAVYGNSSEQAINDKLQIPALFYESITAFKAGNQALSESKFKDFQGAFEKASSSGKSAAEEITKNDKEDNLNSVRVETNLFNQLKKMNNSQTNFVEELWSSNLIVTAINSYSTDHDNKFPKYADIKELVNILKEQKYITIDNISLKDMAYLSSDGQDFTISYKSADKTYTFEEKGRD